MVTQLGCSMDAEDTQRERVRSGLTCQKLYGGIFDELVWFGQLMADNIVKLKNECLMLLRQFD